MTSVLVYAGLVTLLVGFVAVIRPIRRLGLATRWHGAAVMMVGVALVSVAWSLPAREIRASGNTRLDEILPRYQFHEHHERHVDATPAEVWRALHEVRASDIRLFRALTTIRRFGRPGPESILNAPDELPILDVALRTSFVPLGNEAERELVIGTTVIAPDAASVPRTPDEFRTLVAPGFALGVMNFRIEPDGRGGTRLMTDTRVFATDPPTRRAFARYWSLIYPGSALIRREWLGAVGRGARGARGANDSAGTRLHSGPPQSL